MGLTPAFKADLALIGISAVWGSTFVVVKRALGDASPFAFLAVRFLLAGAALGWIFRRSVRPVERGALAGGGVLGLLLALGFAFQTLGLVHTTPSRSAFITGLYVVGVPVIAVALRLRGLGAASLAGVGLALAGLYLMTGLDAAGGGLGRGELLTVFCAVAFAGHIVGVDVFTRRRDARALAFWQVLLAGLLYVPAAFLAETPRLDPTPALAGAVLITSLGGTALAFAVQNAVQARTTPTRTAVIFASEPVFAGVTSYLVEGETMSPAALSGAGLILAGMLAAEIPAAAAARARPAGEAS